MEEVVCKVEVTEKSNPLRTGKRPAILPIRRFRRTQELQINVAGGGLCRSKYKGLWNDQVRS